MRRTTPELEAVGTQLGMSHGGAGYELLYRLRPGLLHVEVVGERRRDLDLDGADFFDLGWSPLFNSLPVLADGLLEAGPPRHYLMRWVDVPSLDVSMSRQQYEPRGDGMVRFRTDDFVSDIRFDRDGFVLDYPGIGTRL